MHRLTAAAAALMVLAACTGDSGTTSTVVDQTTAAETQPLPTDVSELPEVSARQEHERDESHKCVERLALQVIRRVV